MLLAQSVERTLVIEREFIVTSDTAKLLGAHMALMRKQKGWTQDYAAKTAGVHPRTLKSLELGDGNPNLGTLEALAMAYGVTLAAIFEPWKSGAGTAEPHILCKKMTEILKDSAKAHGLKVFIDALYKQLK